MPYDRLGKKVAAWEVKPNEGLYKNYDEVSRKWERDAQRAERNARAVHNTIDTTTGVVAGGAALAATDKECWSNPCVNVCCAAICLASSIAACINPLNVGVFCGVEVTKFTASLCGCGSAFCCGTCIYQTSDCNKEQKDKNAVITSQPRLREERIVKIVEQVAVQNKQEEREGMIDWQ